MKSLLLTFFLFSISSTAYSVELIGHWKFFGFIYQGQEMPPLNPNLKIEMEISEQEILLTYWRENESGFCQRIADYKTSTSDSGEVTLYQKVTWVNLENNSSCSQDMDMRMNYESWTPVYRGEKELQLILPLGPETIIYRFYLSAED